MKTIYKVLICLLILAMPDLMLFENNALGFEPFEQSGFLMMRIVCLIVSLILVAMFNDSAIKNK